MSHEYTAFIVMILSAVLPRLGVTLGSDDLTLFVTTTIAIVAGAYGMFRRYQRGDITVFGSRK